MKRAVSVVVTDLDDTLWDWVETWHRPFQAMLVAVEQQSGLQRNELLADFKQVFTRHGTCEYAFALQELSSLQRLHPNKDIAAVYAPAIDAFRTARREVLKLYPDVLETLQSLKDKGTLLIGYTESMAFYTRYRLRYLGLDRILDYLYSPEDHDLPEGVTPEALRYYSCDHYQLRRTVHRHTPKGKQKPSPQVLLQILSDVGASPADAIYIGDKLVKDVSMAKLAGIVDVHAQYGEAHNREEYELLRQVTHWSPEAVRKEQETTSEQVKPSYVLKRSFREIQEYFDFVPFRDPLQQRLPQVVEVWKKAVDVQQHFNTLEMQIRSFVVTLTVAVVGAAGFAVKEGMPGLGIAVLIAGCIGLFAFAMMDRLWYHRLLLGAVRHAAGIEKRFSYHLPELGLSTSIGKESPIAIGSCKLHSTHKLLAFYGLLMSVLVSGVFLLPRLGPAPGRRTDEQRSSGHTQASPQTAPVPVASMVVPNTGAAVPYVAASAPLGTSQPTSPATQPYTVGVQLPVGRAAEPLASQSASQPTMRPAATQPAA